MKAKRLIYGLVDPRTLLVRYIGLSSHGLARPAKHRYAASLRRKSHKNHWIKALRAEGLDYIIVVLEESPQDLNATEIWWIAYGRACGWPLTNLTDGGEGQLGFVPSPETRAKLSAATKGIPKPPERRAQMIATHLGKKRPVETREKIALAAWGRKVSDETRAKLSAAGRGRSPTPAHRAALSVALTGRKVSEETRRRLSAARRTQLERALCL